MKLEWMGPYREMIGDFYRSANGYSQLCKTEMFGDPVRFSPYEVQIMEHILEYADQHKNMKWYAERLGLSQATYSKYVRKLVDKGLVEKYHASGNKPDQHPGWVGMGWTLHAGGCINRIVNGLKDEMSLYEFNNVYHGNPHCNPGYLHHASDTQDEINWDNDSELEEEMAVIVSSAQYSPVVRGLLDREPDEFQVNIEDIHASFYFVSSHDIKIVSREEPDFTVSYTVKPGYNGTTNIELFHADIGFSPIRVSTFDYIDSFIITNHDGTKYYFGQDESAIEFSVSPNINQQGASSGFSGTATANSWMLTRIERPDGETVVFQYVKNGMRMAT